jgi:hypothetical protein
MSAGNPAASYSLFKVGRTKDANEIFYDINLTSNGSLNVENPINIYWIKKTKGGTTEPLTSIQTKFAYGVDYLSKNEHSAVFQFVSYDKRTFTLKKDNKGVFRVFTSVRNKEVIVNQIYVYIVGGSFWFPTVPKVELHATDLITGIEFTEVIYT